MTYILFSQDSRYRKSRTYSWFQPWKACRSIALFPIVQGQKSPEHHFRGLQSRRQGASSFAYSLLGGHGMEWLKTILRGFNGSDRMPSIGYLFAGQRRSMKAYSN